MADVKLLKYDGTEQQYRGVERVQLARADGGTAIFSEGEAVEGIEISPDFSSGDMPVLAPTGTLVKSAVIVKPENLVPGNIRKGVSVAGIEGDLIGDAEERTVDLNMAGGDQIILPSQDGKVISKVTVAKPETLVPKNILAGVDIGGVVGALDPPDPVETEVILDFSDGDMEVVPDVGKLFNKVLIPVPENMIAENIAEGVNICGIIGSLVGGSSVKIASGKITGTGAAYTLNHGLGLVPDIVAVWTVSASTGYLRNVVGFSSKVLSITGFTAGQFFVCGPQPNSGNATAYIECTYNTMALTYANEQTVNIGSSKDTVGYLQSSIVYQWLAIGGLT